MMLRKSTGSLAKKAAELLRQGISPRRLALTLALGFAVGCIPIVGSTTVICTLLAIALRLNLPAIQAANYAVMPLQIALILPLVRMGRWITASGSVSRSGALSLLHASPYALLTQMSALAGQAMLAWLLVAAPAVLVLTAGLTVLLRRIPALAAVEAAD